MGLGMYVNNSPHIVSGREYKTVKQLGLHQVRLGTYISKVHQHAVSTAGKKKKKSSSR
jgi:hypothetical protein